MFDALPGSSSSCVVMFAQRLSKYCEVNFAARNLKALTLAEIVDDEVTGEDCSGALISGVLLFEKHTTKGPPECHDSMPSCFPRRAATPCAVFDPVCIREMYERGQGVGVLIVM